MYKRLTLSARDVYAAKDLLGAPRSECEAAFRLLPLIDIPPDFARSEASLMVLGLKEGSLVSSTGVIGESPLPLEEEVLGGDGGETVCEKHLNISIHYIVII